MVAVDNPIHFLRHLIQRFPDIKTLTPIDYHFIKREPNDGRRLIRVERDNFTKDCLALMAQLEGTDRDVAISSAVVMTDGRICHIPMMDFLGEIPFSQVFSIKCILAAHKMKRCYIYRTGRSYHLYGLELLEYEEWLEWRHDIQRLAFADVNWARWAEHHNYLSLRLTRNQAHYQGVPSLVYRGGLHGFYVPRPSVWQGSGPGELPER